MVTKTKKIIQIKPTRKANEQKTAVSVSPGTTVPTDLDLKKQKIAASPKSAVITDLD
jgi:hypothetical protein